jgi:hypothetical protein
MQYFFSKKVMEPPADKTAQTFKSARRLRATRDLGEIEILRDDRAPAGHILVRKQSRIWFKGR